MIGIGAGAGGGNVGARRWQRKGPVLAGKIDPIDLHPLQETRIVTIQLELKPDIEATLLAQAHARGLSLEAYLVEVLQNATVAKRQAGRKSLAQMFAESPLKGFDLSFERDRDVGRLVNL